MKTFDRVGPSPFLPDGTTRNTTINFTGGAILKVYGGSPYHNFRLKFDNSTGEGWWVGLEPVDLLIAELLYIRRDMQRFKDGIDSDIEVGREPAAGDVWSVVADEQNLSDLVEPHVELHPGGDDEEEDATF